ncbi:galactoside 2-alpha-L-fucosyltransferase-like isoform X2 [Actinidia eriantha]|nr:galactoside 2-alpha-L-fucosyltransferase-like isoform X2 [Actinidia eriantha]XP_057507656.1 galactoside 2-alpha-L-fucosyltransferase-like isoform X2 [Actinidia eriantha]XP_057507657.1 galactoside 2-alpha-L-fucosyltransferase-like isoform X2 [Actinidia eriantha]XP_057507658.1 galactoside 2-alpha-L-fucosyltransferase-like isoform X2 [Actinidia eriantha]XP_057507659.1 galactoside 2-alpha-L-fucosyltransferase-like isoform X2 [Actinidia eriantha]XP_057507660.1 galactoside 2-alpha-L-fucosyltransf
MVPSNVNFRKVMAACLVALPVLITFSVIYRTPSIAEAMDLQDKADQIDQQRPDSGDYSSQPDDKLLRGLLVPGFNEGSCLSRYQAASYRKPVSYHEASSYLLSRLRRYEDLHKRCGPYTKLYDKTAKLLISGRSSGPTECKYVVWASYSDLPNKMLTLASAFLYALITNRVLLVDRGHDVADLFCEPFPNTSWLLPTDFPILNQFKSLGRNSSSCYGNMLRNGDINHSQETLPSFLYLHLAQDYGDHDKMFFCDHDQALLAKVPWLVMKADNYFVPSLFLIPLFERELGNLFPVKGTVFHQLGRYLLHPTNKVWGLITSYYQAYLAKADETLGIQIKVFDDGPEPLPRVIDQILACTRESKLLPEVKKQESIIAPAKNQKTKAVLVTASNSGYYESLRNVYWEHPTVTGEVIGFFQPSHEEHRKNEDMHNFKLWAEIYLLSLTDTLVTSSLSTMGYVAQGLAGLNPLILYKPEDQQAPDQPCRWGMSMEPCFLAPPLYDCHSKMRAETNSVQPYVRRCEDTSKGVKLVDGISDDIS